MDRVWDWVAIRDDLRVGVTTSRRELATSTVVVTGRRALVVDPSWDPDELAGLAADLVSAGIEVAAGFATHAHHDHLLWHPGLGDVPRWASPVTATAAAAGRPALVSALGPHWPAELGRLVGLLEEVAGERVPWDGPEVHLITHNAHAAGHTALWIPDVAVLLAGDMLSDVEIPLLEESSPADYEQGLALLEPFVRRAAALVPGHGHVAIGPAAATARWRDDDRYFRSLRSGQEAGDPRVQLAGMADLHRHNQSRARPTG